MLGPEICGRFFRFTSDMLLLLLPLPLLGVVTRMTLSFHAAPHAGAGSMELGGGFLCPHTALRHASPPLATVSAVSNHARCCTAGDCNKTQLRGSRSRLAVRCHGAWLEVTSVAAVQVRCWCWCWCSVI